MLRVENVTHSFKNGNETTAVLHQIDFSVKKGDGCITGELGFR